MPITYRHHPVNVPFRTDNQIKFEAEKLIADYVSACGSIKFPLDVQDVIWSLIGGRDNLILKEPEFLGNDQDGKRVVGFTTGDYEGGVIRVDQSIVDTPMFWFTIAHELGHWILHRDLLIAIFMGAKSQKGGMASLQYHLEGKRHVGTPPEEWQANRFATHLLMPEKDIREFFVSLVSKTPLNYTERCQNVGRFAQQYPKVRDYTRMLVAKNYPYDMRTRFRVSKEAMAIRLEELNLVLS